MICWWGALKDVKRNIGIWVGSSVVSIREHGADAEGHLGQASAKEHGKLSGSNGPTTEWEVWVADKVEKAGWGLCVPRTELGL